MMRTRSFAVIVLVSIALAVLAGQALALTQQEAQLSQMKYYLQQAGQQLLQAQDMIEEAKKQGVDVSYAIQEFARAKEAYDQAVANAHDAEMYYEFGEYDVFSSLALNATVQSVTTILSVERISDDVQVMLEQKRLEEGNWTWTEKLNALELEINATQKRYDELNTTSPDKQEGLGFLNQSRYYLSQARLYDERHDEGLTRKYYLLSAGSLKQAQIVLQDLLLEKGEAVPAFVAAGAARELPAEPVILPPAGNQTGGPGARAQDNTVYLIVFTAVLGIISLAAAVGRMRAKRKPVKTKTLYEMLLEQEKKKKGS